MRQELPTSQLTQEGVYGNTASYKAAPNANQVAAGVVPLDTLPAQWWNWLWNSVGKDTDAWRSELTAIRSEILNVLKAANGSDAAFDDSVTQLSGAISKLVTRIATATVAGAIKSSSDIKAVSVDGDTGVATVNAMADWVGTSTIEERVSAAETTISDSSDEIAAAIEEIPDIVADAVKGYAGIYIGTLSMVNTRTAYFELTVTIDTTHYINPTKFKQNGGYIFAKYDSDIDLTQWLPASVSTSTFNVKANGSSLGSTRSLVGDAPASVLKGPGHVIFYVAPGTTLAMGTVRFCHTGRKMAFDRVFKGTYSGWDPDGATNGNIKVNMGPAYPPQVGDIVVITDTNFSGAIIDRGKNTAAVRFWWFGNSERMVDETVISCYDPVDNASAVFMVTYVNIDNENVVVIPLTPSISPAEGSNTAAKDWGTASAGTSTKLSRADHVHPTHIHQVTADVSSPVVGDIYYNKSNSALFFGSVTPQILGRGTALAHENTYIPGILYGVCSTAANSSAKVMSNVYGSTSAALGLVILEMRGINAAANPTLTIGSRTYSIYQPGKKAITSTTAGILAEGANLLMIVDAKSIVVVMSASGNAYFGGTDLYLGE